MSDTDGLKADVENLKRRVALLEVEAGRAKHLALAIAIAASRPEKLSPEHVLNMVRHVAAFAGLDDERVAEALLINAEWLETLTMQREMEPDAIIASLLALHLDGGLDRGAALNEWLHAATPEEIADDLQQSFERLRRESPPDPKGSSGAPD